MSSEKLLLQGIWDRSEPLLALSGPQFFLGLVPAREAKAYFHTLTAGRAEELK
jgi:hypothetical protein